MHETPSPRYSASQPSSAAIVLMAATTEVCAAPAIMRRRTTCEQSFRSKRTSASKGTILTGSRRDLHNTNVFMLSAQSSIKQSRQIGKVLQSDL